MPKMRYVEDECDEYEKDSFVVSDEESESAESESDEEPVPKKAKLAKAAKEPKEAKAAKEAKEPKAAKEAKEAKEPQDVKVFSNKTLDASRVPPKPVMKPKTKSGKPYDFRLIFTNGTLLRKFLEPAAHAVKKMRFVICMPQNSEDFRGFKIECHDQAFTLADRGLFECDVDSNKATSPDGTSFCVTAEAFMEALVSSTLKETDLSITRYCGADGSEGDKITFESTNNENDVRTVYTCGLVDSSNVDSLDGLTIDLGFHVNVQMSTLKELSLNARRCGAPTLRFDLWQAPDATNPNITHSKMCVGFEGTNTSGAHDFFISMQKDTKQNASGESEVTWTLSSPKGQDMESLQLEKKCSNEYDNKKLRMFLNHMECQYVLVHLCTDNTTKPLVLDCVLGGARTKHTVIVAPKETGS
jgi:hypothetical protein